MTIQLQLMVQWLNTWIGRVCRDGQCVAMFRQFIQDVWKVVPFEGLGINGGAKELFFRHWQLPTQARLADLFTWDPACPDIRPLPGDAVIFRESPTNQWGHVAIFVMDTIPGREMMVVEQSGIAAMNNETARMGVRFGTWNNDRLLGWLRKKAV